MRTALRALALIGPTLVPGASGQAPPSAAAVRLDPLRVIAEAQLVASDGAAGDQLGVAVALGSETAVVGTFDDDDGGDGSGSAYVFVRSGTTWTEQAKLVASDAAPGDRFGFAAAADGDTVALGAFLDDGAAVDAGAAYVFVRTGTTWSEQAKLVASDAEADDRFGFSLSLAGDTLVVGAFQNDAVGANSGAVYVYVRTGTQWAEETRLTAADATGGEQLGRSVAISGDTVLAGAHSDSHAGSFSGSAYVFVRAGTSWTEEAKLVASKADECHVFGSAVALDGETALIGAPGEGHGVGAAYVFERSGAVWSESARLLGRDTSCCDSFGFAVALAGGRAVVGAPTNAIGGPSVGSAYVFLRGTTTWLQGTRLVAVDSEPGDAAAQAVAVAGTTVIVGARVDDGVGSDSGSAAVYVLEDARTCGLGLGGQVTCP